MRMTSYADRSWTGGLALCRCAGGVCLCRELRSQSVVVHPPLIAAVLATAVFAAIFVFWTYYPHGLPLPTSITKLKSPVTTVVPTAPAAPQRPSNPVTDITTPPTTSR